MAKSRFTEGEHDDDHDDTKTVSGWGMDEEEEAARKEVEESESDDYHTADEEDDDDDRKTKSHMHHEKVLPMEIRPRESWKEDFTMIENLQHVRTDDDDEEENEFDEPPRKRKSHVRQVTDDPVIQAARERRQKRRRLRNRRISSKTPSATSTAVTKKRKHDDDESSTTESEEAPSDALDRLPTYADTKRKQQQKQPSRTFTKQQIQVLQEGVETHGDNAWDIIIGEAKGGILRDKKPWQCRQYYQQNMMSEEL